VNDAVRNLETARRGAKAQRAKELRRRRASVRLLLLRVGELVVGALYLGIEQRPDVAPFGRRRVVASPTDEAHPDLRGLASLIFAELRCEDSAHAADELVVELADADVADERDDQAVDRVKGVVGLAWGNVGGDNRALVVEGPVSNRG
jgi:hypothetical protein